MWELIRESDGERERERRRERKRERERERKTKRMACEKKNEEANIFFSVIKMQMNLFVSALSS